MGKVSHKTIHTLAALHDDRCPECGEETKEPPVPVPYGLEPIDRNDALAMTRGDLHELIRDHPGQSYLILRRESD